MSLLIMRWVEVDRPPRSSAIREILPKTAISGPKQQSYLGFSLCSTVEMHDIALVNMLVYAPGVSGSVGVPGDWVLAQEEEERVG